MEDYFEELYQPRAAFVGEFSYDVSAHVRRQSYEYEPSLETLQPLEIPLQSMGSHERQTSTVAQEVQNNSPEQSFSDSTEHEQTETESSGVAMAVAGFGLILNGLAEHLLSSNRQHRQAVNRGGIDMGILQNQRRLFELTRLTPEAFNELHEILKPFLTLPICETGRPPHSSEIVLLTGLCHLAGGQRLVSTGEVLKIGSATVNKHLKTVVNAVLQASQAHDALKVAIGDVDRRASVFDGVLQRFGGNGGRSPRVIGAIDVTHVPIVAPRLSAADAYYTITKRCYSISVQAVSDWDLNLCSVMAGFPGRMNDARIFTETEIGNHIPAGFRILGDGAYPASSMLISPFRACGVLTPRQCEYNVLVSQARNCIERTFGNLKKRWRILTNNEIRDLAFLNRIILACASLHNFCQRRNVPEPEDVENAVEARSEVRGDHEEDSHPDCEGSLQWRHFYMNMLLS